jgi:ubiquitin-protein ligase
MTTLFYKKIKNEIKKYAKDNFTFENLKLQPDESDSTIWYFLIYDLIETPFEKGMYFGKILLDTNYPIKPPDFVFLTPNGRFETNRKICTSFSGFHPEMYSSTWNIQSLMQGVISFMTDTKDIQGIGSLNTTDEIKKQFAEKSINWNNNNTLYNKIHFN